MDNHACETLQFGAGGAKPLWPDPVACPMPGSLRTPLKRSRNPGRESKVDDKASSPGARWRWLIIEE